MIKENLNIGGLSMDAKKDGIAQIRMVMGQVTQMGNNDSEIPTLERLIEQVENGGDIQEAVMQANKILQAKIMNDYH